MRFLSVPPMPSSFLGVEIGDLRESLQEVGQLRCDKLDVLGELSEGECAMFKSIRAIILNALDTIDDEGGDEARSGVKARPIETGTMNRERLEFEWGIWG